MAPRITPGRSVALVLAALLIGSAAPPPPAAAQSGNGLYEPFPEAAVKRRAQRYVDRLRDRTPGAGHRYSDAELAAGVFVRPDPRGAALSPPSTPSHRGAASARAGAQGAADVVLPVQLLLLLAAVVLPATALMSRARARAG